MQIFIIRNNQQHGPFTLASLQSAIDTGNLIGAELAWYEGAPGWIPLAQVPGIRVRQGSIPPPIPNNSLPPQQAQLPGQHPVSSVNQNFSPPAIFGIKQPIIARFVAPGERVVAGGMLSNDTEYTVIVIPLYFNIITQYLIFTDKRVIYAKKTLWRGFEETIEILYSDVDSVVVTLKNKNLYKYAMGYTREDTDSKILVRLKSGEFTEFFTRNHAYFGAVVERINQIVTVTVEP